MKVSLLTTFRQADEQRLLNLEKVVDHVVSAFPEWEILVIEQSERETLASHPLAKKTRYVHAYNPGPFNKSWGMNIAYKQSSGDILVVSDADMVVRQQDLQRAVSACEKELDAVRPYGQLIDMSEKQTAEYIQGLPLPEYPVNNQSYNRQYVNESLCLAGGMFVIRRSFYQKVGGMDERFCGWGGEDDAMSVKMQKLTEKVAISKKAIAWHLWHKRASRDESDLYRQNVKLCQQYIGMSKEEIIALNEGNNDIGNTAKYS